jgi:hypothetical protein
MRNHNAEAGETNNITGSQKQGATKCIFQLNQFLQVIRTREGVIGNLPGFLTVIDIGYLSIFENLRTVMDPDMLCIT